MKKLSLVCLLVTLALVLVAAPVSAIGPPGRAMGSGENYNEDVCADCQRYFRFSVVETRSGEIDGSGYYLGLRYENGIETNRALIVVSYVRVDGDTAWFAGQCKYNSPPAILLDSWVVFQVYDGDSTGADEIRWQVCASEEQAFDMVLAGIEPDTAEEVIGGNLIVYSS